MARLSFAVMLTAALGAGAAGAQEAADAPEFYEVTGIPAGETLNLRGTPSAAGEVVANVARGTVLRNLGCNEDPEPWCEVETAEGGPRGWVAGRYLVDRAPSQPVTDVVAEIPPTGTVFCSLDQAARAPCPFVVQRKEGGAIEVVVTFADGFERALEFDGGDVWSPDPTDEVSARRADGVTEVGVNAVERIEILDAVVMPE